MKVHDFQYAGKNLSDFGFIICNFGGKGLDTISNGATVTFNTVATLSGAKHELVGSVYEDCLESSIQICKNPCGGNNMEIDSATFRELTRWLCRKRFLKLKFLSEEYIDLYYEAKFDVSRIELDGKLVGLELNITTNRPFALKESKTITIENTIESGKLQRIYIWEKYAVTEDALIERRVSDTVIAAGYKTDENSNVYDDWSHIKCADEIMISNGEISLVSPKYVGITMYLSDEIKGKYIYESYSGRYFKMPPVVNLRFNTTDSCMSVTVSDAYVLTVEDDIKDFLGNISSENISDYPTDGIQGGYYYVFIKEEFLQKEKCSINDTSHEEGHIYPYTEITIAEDGDLNIYNALEDRNTFIANCVAGEVITMDYPVIKSSISSHNIQNDFNWNFFRIANTYGNSRNDLTISIPCSIKIKYSPIIKVGI